MHQSLYQFSVARLFLVILQFITEISILLSSCVEILSNITVILQKYCKILLQMNLPQIFIGEFFVSWTSL